MLHDCCNIFLQKHHPVPMNPAGTNAFREASETFRAPPKLGGEFFWGHYLNHRYINFDIFISRPHDLRQRFRT